MKEFLSTTAAQGITGRFQCNEKNPATLYSTEYVAKSFYEHGSMCTVSRNHLITRGLIRVSTFSRTLQSYDQGLSLLLRERTF